MPPSPRDVHTAVFNAPTNRMVMFAGRICTGGCSGPEFFALNDVWVLTDVIPNQPPVANAGLDQTVEATSPSGASVTLDGSGSSDTDGDPLTYEWTGSFVAASGVSPTVVLPLGAHILTLTVDNGQATAMDTVYLTVLDTTSPETTITSAVDGGSTLSDSITFILGAQTLLELQDSSAAWMGRRMLPAPAR